MSNPKSEALAYRIWAYANPRGWDVTNSEIADALSAGEGKVSVHQVARLCAWKKWNYRLRKTEHRRMDIVLGGVGLVKGFDTMNSQLDRYE